MDSAERAEREIVGLHRFFEGWFNGRLPATDEAFFRFESALGDGFEMVTPTGVVRDRAGVLAAVRGAHPGRAVGEGEPNLSISIRNVRILRAWVGHVLVTYEEHQTRGGEALPTRISTALLDAHDAGPNGLRWIHLHETWIGGERPVEKK